VKVVRQDELRNNIYTTASYCNSFILKPFCLISKSKYFYTRKYLDHQELQRDVLRIRVFYWKRGYREAEVDTAVVRRGKNQVGVTFNIREGPATVVSDIVVTQDSTVLSEREIADRIALGKNGPLNLIRLDSSRFNLQARMFDKGYADAEVDTATVIDSTSHTATVKFNLVPKYKTTVEDIVITGNDDVDRRTILKSLTFHVGDIFKRSEMLRSQRALYESNLFRRAAIEPRPPVDISLPDSAKIVVVNVTEAPFHEARVSAGFNTIDFAQVESRFTSYNFRGGARRLDVVGVVGNLFAKSLNGRGIFRNATVSSAGALARYYVPTYNASIDLTQPWFGSPHNTLSAGIFTHRRSAPGIYIDRGYGSSFTFTRELTERAPASLNYRFEVSKVDAGDVYFCINFGVCDAPTLESLRGNQKLSPITITAGLDRSNDPFSPNRGFRANGSVEHASTFTASDYRYNRATADGAAYYQIRRRASLSGHLRAANPQKYLPQKGADYPRSQFGQRLMQIAQLIKANVGLEVAFADVGGWDTHVNQGSSTGQLAQRLDDFSRSIAALVTDLGDRMDDVVIMTMSEFGRMARENGNRGTDHGHAGALFVIGGHVRGGKVHGKWPGLEPEQLYEGRDLALTTDFRSVFAEVVSHHMGARTLDRIFPGFSAAPSNFVGVV
jgi:outer membrane protein assembly factor BamA